MARLGLENLKEGIRPQTNSLVVDENGCRGRGGHQNEVSSDYRILLGAVDAFASKPVKGSNAHIDTTGKCEHTLHIVINFTVYNCFEAENG